MMNRALVAGLAAAGAVGLAVGGVSLASASSDISSATTLHLVSPIKGKITTPTSDLTVFAGPVTDRGGHRMGTLQGYCATVEDKTGTGECTTTFFLRGGQLTLIGPIHNRGQGAVVQQGVAAGTGNYQNARGQATLTLQRNKNIDYRIDLIP